MAIVPILSWRN